MHRTKGSIAMLCAWIVSTCVLPHSRASINLPEGVGGWVRAGPDKQFAGREIFTYMDGAGELYLAYAFKSLTVREYRNPPQPPIVLELYDMSNPSDAFGVFTLDIDGTQVNIGKGGIYSAGLLRFWKGRYFVRVITQQETPASKAAVLGLAEKASDAVSDEGDLPVVVRAVPQEGLLKNEIRYFHTTVPLNLHYYLSEHNILGLSKETEVVLARYQLGSRKVRILVCLYPNRQQALNAHRAFAKDYLRTNPKASGVTTACVERGLYAGAALSNRVLVLGFEFDSARLCAAFIEKVKKSIRGLLREAR
ncbi:MAG: DUF6599 family protein [Armatimonadota bacterium]